MEPERHRRGGAWLGSARRVSCPGPDRSLPRGIALDDTEPLSAGAATTLDLCGPWRTSAVNHPLPPRSTPQPHRPDRGGPRHQRPPGTRAGRNRTARRAEPRAVTTGRDGRRGVAGGVEEVAGTRGRGSVGVAERSGSGRRMVRGLVTLQLRGSAGASPSTPPPHLAGPAGCGAPGNCGRRRPTSRWNPRGIGGAGRCMARSLVPGPDRSLPRGIALDDTDPLSAGAVAAVDLCGPWRASAVNHPLPPQSTPQPHRLDREGRRRQRLAHPRCQGMSRSRTPGRTRGCRVTPQGGGFRDGIPRASSRRATA